MKYYPINLMATLMTAVTLNSCQPNNAEIIAFANVEEMVENAKSSIISINADYLMKMIEGQWRIQIIDCREPDQYAMGHIPGAINVPRGDLGFSTKATNRRLTTLVFGNEKGSGALAAVTMKKLKYRNVTYIDCTWSDWHAVYPDQIETGLGTLDIITEQQAASGGCGD